MGKMLTQWFLFTLVVSLFIGYATLAPTDVLIWSIHYDPGQNEPHLFPLASEMPHGGFKESGYGKDMSLYSMEEYTRIKHVAVKLA